MAWTAMENLANTGIRPKENHYQNATPAVGLLNGLAKVSKLLI
jgi:hypothetical protein